MANQKVLLVDDTRLILELMKNSLKLSPLEVQTASNGMEALDQIRKEVPDLIFMDVNMPLMDGIECCTIIKEDPFLCSIPIVMLTSMGNEDVKERCRAAGCDDFLTKPIDRQLFLAKARYYINVVERREIRIPCRVPLIFRIDGISLHGLSGDVSEGGIYIATEREVLEDAPLELAFFLPSPEAPVVRAIGKVSWINSGRERVKPDMPIGFGVKFVDIDGSHQAHIRQFIEGKIR